MTEIQKYMIRFLRFDGDYNTIYNKINEYTKDKSEYNYDKYLICGEECIEVFAMNYISYPSKFIVNICRNIQYDKWDNVINKTANFIDYDSDELVININADNGLVCGIVPLLTNLDKFSPIYKKFSPMYGVRYLNFEITFRDKSRIQLDASEADHGIYYALKIPPVSYERSLQQILYKHVSDKNIICCLDYLDGNKFKDELQSYMDIIKHKNINYEQFKLYRIIFKSLKLNNINNIDSFILKLMYNVKVDISQENASIFYKMLMYTFDNNIPDLTEDKFNEQYPIFKMIK